MSHDTDLEKLQEKKERNKVNRKKFIELWAEYVKEHDDNEWS